MQLDPLRSPPLLPPGIACYTARLIGGDHRLHFAAGRACAARAMAQLGVPAAPIDRGPGGEPVWPEGLTGSITHKGEYVSAAVARTTDVLSLGIDAEEIIDAGRAARIAPRVVLPRETAVGGGSLDAAVRVVLLFSIKESVFKCLYPLVLKRFYYDALAVTDVDLDAGTFRGTCLTPLSDRFPCGALVTGRVMLDEHRVYSAAWLAHDTSGRSPGRRVEG